MGGGAAEPAPEQPAPEAAALTTTQWLALGSLVGSLIGLYYKCEEIQNAFRAVPQAAPPPSQTPYDRPIITTSRGVRNMD